MAQSTRGDRLGRVMELRGWRKHAALAKALGVNVSTVSRWRSNGSLSLEHAVALCDLLDVSLDWLLLGRGSPDCGRQTQCEFGVLQQRAREALTCFTAALPDLFGTESRLG